MPSVKVRDVELYYEQAGSGEPLLLIMGLGCPSQFWMFQTEEFAKRFTVITFDNRGIGKSGVGSDDYSIEVFADDAAGLLQELGVERSHVLGISMGGAIAQQMAIRHPKLVNRLVLGCTWRKTSAFGRVMLRVWRDVAVRAGLETLTWLTLTQYLTPGFIDAHEDTVARLAEIAATRVTLETYLKQNLACERHDTSGKLSRWNRETLVLVGKRDGQTTPAAARELASELPNANLVMLDGVGHGMMWEAPERFNEAVLTFLDTT